MRVAAPGGDGARRRRIFNPALGDYEVQRVLADRRRVPRSYVVTCEWDRDPRELPGAGDLTAWHAASIALLDLDGGPHELRHEPPGHAPPNHSFGAGRPYDEPPIPTWHATDARAARAAP